MYIGPISERSFFLGLSILALLVVISGLVAFSGLMPLAEAPPLIVKNDRLATALPTITRLRSNDMSVNDAMRRFMIEEYVRSREGYTAEEFLKGTRFVFAHSDAATTAAFGALVSADNPNNPVATFGGLGMRLVTIRSVVVDARNDPQQAVVRFSTGVVGGDTVSKSEWTATMQFHYSDVVISEGKDPQTGERSATMSQPEFQVISYVLSPRS